MLVNEFLGFLFRIIELWVSSGDMGVIFGPPVGGWDIYYKYSRPKGVALVRRTKFIPNSYLLWPNSYHLQTFAYQDNAIGLQLVWNVSVSADSDIISHTNTHRNTIDTHYIAPTWCIISCCTATKSNAINR